MIKNNLRLFGSHLADEFKKASDELKKESRLFAQTNFDEKATSMATKSPTVQIFHKKKHYLFTHRSLSWSHTHGIFKKLTSSQAPSWVKKVPSERKENYNCHQDTSCIAFEPLYGIPECELYWYLTYL